MIQHVGIQYFMIADEGMQHCLTLLCSQSELGQADSSVVSLLYSWPRQTFLDAGHYLQPVWSVQMHRNAEVTLWAKSSSKAAGPHPIVNETLTPLTRLRSNPHGLFHVSVVSVDVREYWNMSLASLFAFANSAGVQASAPACFVVVAI